ncbi:MAG: hypothetical protein ACLUHE_13810 [Christensenellales bacterium]
MLADDVPLCAFQNPKDGLVRVPLAHALHAGRRQTLRLCFDASRPAGVLGPVCLHLTTRARLRDIALWPDAQTKTVRLRAALSAMETGRFVLRARAACAGEALPVHDLPVSLTAGEPQTVEMTLPLPENRSSPANQRTALPSAFSSSRRGGTARSATSSRCCAAIPARPRNTIFRCSRRMSRSRRAAGAHRAAVSARRSAGRARAGCILPRDDAFRRVRPASLCDAGPAGSAGAPCLRRLRRRAAPRMRSLPALDAWLLCGLTACPRTPPADATPAELLLEAAGRELDAQSPNIAAVLLRLSRRPHPAAGRGRAAGALFRRALPARRLAGRGCIRRPANRARADAPERPAPVRRLVRGFGLQRVGQRVRRCAGRGRRVDRPRVARG